MTDALCSLLKQARCNARMTQEEAGALIYMSGNGYGKVERGLRGLETKQLLALCHGLGIPVADMLGAFVRGQDGGGPSCNDYQGGFCMKDSNKRSTMEDTTKGLLAGALVAHADYVCITAGLDYDASMSPADNLARLLVEVMLDGSREIEDPGHRLQDALESGYCNAYGLQPDLQDEMAEAALAVIDNWKGKRALPLKELLHNIMWGTDFDAVELCPCYSTRINILRKKFYDAANKEREQWDDDYARRKRICVSLKHGHIIKCYGNQPGEFEYVLLVAGGLDGIRAKGWDIVRLYTEDKHTLINTASAQPFVQVHVAGGLCPEIMYADMSCFFALSHEAIYDVVGMVDKPALDVILDIFDNYFHNHHKPEYGYGSCIRYNYEGSVRYGIITYIDRQPGQAGIIGTRRVNLMDVFFLTEAEAAADPGYIRLSKDPKDIDGELFYKFDFPDNVYPYLKKGCTTEFHEFQNDVTDIQEIGRWPSKADSNDRIRDLMAVFHGRLDLNK